jgi:hypothetical protein
MSGKDGPRLGKPAENSPTIVPSRRRFTPERPAGWPPAETSRIIAQMLRAVFLTSTALLASLLVVPRVDAQTVPLFDGAFHSAPLTANVTTVAADVNGDGKADLVGITIVPGNQGKVFLGNGDGTFQPAIPFNAGENVFALGAADLDRNGTVDLVTLGVSTGLRSWKGNGDGTFSSWQATSIGSTGNYNAILALGDINGDGLPDAVLSLPYNNSIQVYLNEGNGRFGAGPSFSMAGFIQGIAVAHFDRDSLGDVVVASDAGGPSQISTFQSVGFGNLTPIDQRIVAGARNGIAVGDFNGDGIDDVAAAPFRLPQISILLGTGGGHLRPSVEYNAGGGIVGFVLADQNGDGRPDLIAEHDQIGVSVLLSVGDGTFRPSLESIAPGSVDMLSGVAADFNGDGRIDAVFGGEIFLSHGDGTFGLEARYQGGQPRFASGDLTGDGLADLAVLNFDSGLLTILAGAGDGTFTPFRQCTAGPRQRSDALGVGDVNGDGIDDAVVSTSLDDGSFDVATFFGGPFRDSCPAAHTPVPEEIDQIVLADLDGDGHEDMISLTRYKTYLSIWKGKSDGTFERKATENTLLEPTELRLTDLNHDGKPDLVVLNSGSGALSVYLGLGGFEFTPPAYFPTGQSPQHVVLSDFDGDSNPDAIVQIQNGSSFLRGDGTGAFANPVSMGQPRNATGPLAAADFDGDGITDLAVANTPHIEIWRGHGDATFDMLESVGAGGNGGLSLLDIDRNGTSDLLSDYGGYVTTIPNRSPAPPIPQVDAHVSASNRGVAIQWTGTLGGGIEGRVFRKQGAADWEAHASMTSDSTGQWNYEDGSVQAGQSYQYDLRLSGRVVSTVGVQTPVPAVLSFSAIAPNPSRASASVTFALPSGEKASLGVFDVRGRATWSREVGSMGPGIHTVELGTGANWRSGVYRVRLVQGAQAVTGSFVILR